MNPHHTITSYLAEDKRRDMLATAERARLARQARSVAPASQTRASRRHGWQLVRQLRLQAQS